MAPMEAPATTDEALLRRYAAGEVAAFDLLYGRHELPLWRYILRRSGDRAAADELAQEVWFAVAREATRFRSDGRFRPWLYTMARNRVIDRARTAKWHTSLDVAPAGSEIPLVEQLIDERVRTPEQALESGEQGRAVLAALEQLPPEQRESFILQVDAGLTVEEIAAVTGTRFETAKSRLRYARERLKSLLQDFA
jgi:RNA polymerase sigma-70 factor, ECF subfamily